MNLGGTCKFLIEQVNKMVFNVSSFRLRIGRFQCFSITNSDPTRQEAVSTMMYLGHTGEVGGYFCNGLS